MLNRRELLRGGFTASALAGLPIGRLHGTRSDSFCIAVVDSELAASAEMCAHLGRMSDRLHIFAGDPGTLWMSSIEPRIRSAAVSLAGYTSPATLFCLQYLAMGYGLVLTAQQRGPQPIEIMHRKQFGLVDLRDPEFSDASTGVTWLLTMRRG